MALFGQPFDWVAESGAPRAGRRFLLFQPTTSPYTLTLELFAELLRSSSLAKAPKGLARRQRKGRRFSGGSVSGITRSPNARFSAASPAAA